MQSQGPTQGRYELLAEIGSGDFAKVYRARDRELGREVAIKQIHQQYLGDARRLEQFWREAQLLASLEHRSIMTIYDMVRSRGWLVLELMPASLRDFARGQPLDLDLLRVVLSCSLQALEFLHANNIVHGDIKPSNLFLDKRSWVKVGDFGLARRVSNEHGSLLKGTTRYMAPELVSPHYGPVGPASDLYSLGFSAYELMCGEQFDSLFPGMEAFGRDKQIAWMMWHAAPDRRLPPIDRVLAGVPDDLRAVIQRLATKNPAERYKTAAEALADMKSRLMLGDSGAAAKAAEELAAAAMRRKRGRILAISGGLFVVGAGALALAVLNPPAKPSGPPPLPDDVQGIVRTLLPDQHLLVIEELPSHAPKEVALRAEDQLFLNGAPSLFADLQQRDRMLIKTTGRDKSGKEIHDYFATRPDRSRGAVAAVDAESGQLRVKLAGEEGKTLKLSVPADLIIRFNDQEQWQGKPVRIGDLLPGDRVVVEHDGQDEVRHATDLDVARVVPLDGFLRALDGAKRELTIALSAGDKAPLETWPLAESCVVTLNGQRTNEGALLRPSDLKPGDEVTIEHDKKVVAIDAHRVLKQIGVVEAIRPAKHELDIVPKGATRAITCTVASDAKIRLGDETVGLGDLHRGDEVTIAYDSLDIANAEALSVQATRSVAPDRWALVIGEQTCDDPAVAPLMFAVSDARLVAHTLSSRFQVPAGQILLLTDETRARWEESIPAFIGRVSSGAELLVYYVGHAYADKHGKIWLAPKDFVFAKPETTGLALAALVDNIEKCPARQKLLLLDATHGNVKADAKQEPSGAEMIQTLQQPGMLSPLRTLTAIASCKAGERGVDLIERRQGRFADSLAQAYAGAADKNGDNRIAPVELFEYLSTALAGDASPQTPTLFLPDDTPPRLTEAAKLAIRKLAGNLSITKPDLAKTQADFENAEKLAGKEPEAKLIYGLALLKMKKDVEALKIFDELKTEQPNHWLPLEAAVWLRYRRQDFSGGVSDLLQLVGKLAASEAESANATQGVANWSGRMREFAATAASDQRRPPAAFFEQIDEAAGRLPAAAQAAYQQGRQHVKKVAGDFDKQIDDTSDKQEQLAIQVKRRQLTEYSVFPTDASARKLIDGMQK